MNYLIGLFGLACVAIFMTGCFAPMKGEIPLAKGDLTIKATNQNETKLLMFNNSNFALFALDGSGRINVKLNGKNFAQFNIDDYAQVLLPKGKYQFDLAHMDLVKFTSHHELDLTNAESLVEIKATATGHEVRLVQSLPYNFKTKFRPVKASPK